MGTGLLKADSIPTTTLRAYEPTIIVGSAALIRLGPHGSMWNVLLRVTTAAVKGTTGAMALFKVTVRGARLVFMV